MRDDGKKLNKEINIKKTKTIHFDQNFNEK